MKRGIRPGSIRDRIIQHCQQAGGLTLPQIYDLMPDVKSSVLGPAVALCQKEGYLHSSGAPMRKRYFVDQASADAWHPIGVAQGKEESRRLLQARLDRVAQKKRERNAANPKKPGRKPQERPVKAPKPPKPPKLQKPPKPPKSKPWPAIPDKPIEIKAKSKTVPIQQAKAHHAFSRKATVTWPEHVKVQVIPHGEDNRLKFVPPPGWVGEITKDRLKGDKA
jgi:hypothetical protein